MKVVNAAKITVFLLLVMFSVTTLAEELPPVQQKLMYPEVCGYSSDELTSNDCLEFIEANPRPELEYIREDRVTLTNYSFWRVGPEPINKFDGPNGGVIGEIPQGFNFVRAIDTSVDDWLQIEGGEWVRRSDASYTRASYFTGIELPEDWELPFAWVLDTTGIYASLTPGGPSTAESGYLTRRYDLVNIFAEAYDDEGWRWYMIGPDQWIKQTFVAKIVPIERPEGVEGRWVGVDLFEQTLIAYEDDVPVFATLISSGLPGTHTNEGLFTIWARLERDGMSGSTGAPNAYALQSVPWTMYFDGGISLHGTYWHDLFGYRRSRGCVNLSISDARFIYEWTGASEPDEDGSITNYVYVFSSGEYGTAPGQSAR